VTCFTADVAISAAAVVEHGEIAVCDHDDDDDDDDIDDDDDVDNTNNMNNNDNNDNLRMQLQRLQC